MKGRETPFSHAVGRYANPTAGKLTLAKTVFVYMFGGGLGTLWEVIFNVFYQIANDYTIRYIDCRGSLFTYFNPLSGCGAHVIVFFLKKYSRPWQVFTVGALAGGAVEYFLSYCEEAILGTRSWNYDDWLWNINGRTTVPIMIVWGILCMAVVFLLFRPLDRFFEGLPARTFRIIGICCLAALCIDMFFTVSAMLRYVMRDTEPLTAFGRWLDAVFPDELMRRRFPSMKIQ